MVVKELIEILKQHDENMEVFVEGYEAGVESLESITVEKIKKNVCERGIYGEHKIDRYGDEYDVIGLLIGRVGC